MNDGTQQLPETSRNALIRMADALRSEFTGRMEIECSKGRVMKLREIKVRKAGSLKDGAQSSG